MIVAAGAARADAPCRLQPRKLLSQRHRQPQQGIQQHRPAHVSYSESA
eukprot:CAMPEP_0183338412 /NCGR_PEP_ID=MMETSP0164_2-20130417/5721_1 /TAXON_ID=221442 /ORGANISM="Coccolithus pelagicus ssp braarudi, Strain PLY182g" /LENGTH=47 /DNA_ID= /DNA_START= /DNA_END= /DNA_ORIENTATION=